MIGKSLERKFIPGKKYLVGPKNKEMVYYGRSPHQDEVFCNWQTLAGGAIEYLHIKPNNLLLNENHVEDRTGEYFERTIEFTEPKQLGQKDNSNISLTKMLEKSVKILRGELRGDSAEYELGKIQESLLYVELSSVLEGEKEK